MGPITDFILGEARCGLGDSRWFVLSLSLKLVDVEAAELGSKLCLATLTEMEVALLVVDDQSLDTLATFGRHAIDFAFWLTRAPDDL